MILLLLLSYRGTTWESLAPSFLRNSHESIRNNMGSSRGRKSKDWDSLKQPTCSKSDITNASSSTQRIPDCGVTVTYEERHPIRDRPERWTGEDKLQRAPELAPDLSTPCVLSIWWIILVLRGRGSFSRLWTRMMISIPLGCCKDPKRSYKRSGFAVCVKHSWRAASVGSAARGRGLCITGASGSP